jgi:hypothetical protein
LFQSYVNDKNTADKPIKVMGKPFPIVEKERQLKLNYSQEKSCGIT